MSQSELATVAGIAPTMMYRYEKGRNAPNSELLATFAVILHTTTDYLMGLTDDPTPGISPDERALVDAYRNADFAVIFDLLAKRSQSD